MKLRGESKLCTTQCPSLRRIHTQLTATERLRWGAAASNGCHGLAVCASYMYVHSVLRPWMNKTNIFIWNGHKCNCQHHHDWYHLKPRSWRTRHHLAFLKLQIQSCSSVVPTLDMQVSQAQWNRATFAQPKLGHRTGRVWPIQVETQNISSVHFSIFAWIHWRGQRSVQCRYQCCQCLFFWRFSHCRYLRSFVATSHSPALQAFEYLESMSIRQFKKVYLHSRNYQWNLKITLEKGKSPTKPTKPLGFILLGAQPLRKKFGLATPSSQSVINPRLPSIRQELWATWDESKSHAIRNIHIYISIYTIIRWSNAW